MQATLFMYHIRKLVGLMQTKVQREQVLTEDILKAVAKDKGISFEKMIENCILFASSSSDIELAYVTEMDEVARDQMAQVEQVLKTPRRQGYWVYFDDTADTLTKIKSWEFYTSLAKATEVYELYVERMGYATDAVSIWDVRVSGINKVL